MYISGKTLQCGWHPSLGKGLLQYRRVQSQVNTACMHEFIALNYRCGVLAASSTRRFNVPTMINDKPNTPFLPKCCCQGIFPSQQPEKKLRHSFTPASASPTTWCLDDLPGVTGVRATINQYDFVLTQIITSAKTFPQVFILRF